MKTKIRDFGNGDVVRIWAVDSPDGTIYGVEVDKDYELYSELECDYDIAMAVDAFEAECETLSFN